MSQREQQHGGQHSTAASGRRSATAEKARGSVPVLQAAGDSQESAPGTPTREEFEEARERELARLLRLSSLAPQTLSAEQQGLLEHDTTPRSYRRETGTRSAAGPRPATRRDLELARISRRRWRTGCSRAPRMRIPNVTSHAARGSRTVVVRGHAPPLERAITLERIVTY